MNSGESGGSYLNETTSAFRADRDEKQRVRVRFAQDEKSKVLRRDDYPSRSSISSGVMRMQVKMGVSLSV